MVSVIVWASEPVLSTRPRSCSVGLPAGQREEARELRQRPGLDARSEPLYPLGEFHCLHYVRGSCRWYMTEALYEIACTAGL